MLTSLHTPQDTADVVPEFASGNVRHPPIVALLLRAAQRHIDRTLSSKFGGHFVVTGVAGSALPRPLVGS